MSTRQFTIKEILQRARELGILLSIDGDKLRVRWRKGTDTTRARAVFKECKQEIIEYLESHCSICELHINDDEGIANFTPDGLMLCSKHTVVLPTEEEEVLPDTHQDQQEQPAAMTQEQFAAIAQRIADSLPNCQLTIEPKKTLTEHLEQLQAEEQERHRAMMEARRKKRIA